MLLEFVRGQCFDLANFHVKRFCLSCQATVRQGADKAKRKYGDRCGGDPNGERAG